jgi:hypothetical protein
LLKLFNVLFVRSNLKMKNKFNFFFCGILLVLIVFTSITISSALFLDIDNQSFVAANMIEIEQQANEYNQEFGQQQLIRVGAVSHRYPYELALSLSSFNLLYFRCADKKYVNMYVFRVLTPPPNQV